MARLACDNANSTELYQIKGNDGLCYNATYLSDYWQSFNPVNISSEGRLFNFTQCAGTTAGVADQCVNFLSQDFAKSMRNQSTVLGFWDEELSIANRVGSRLTTDEYYFHHVLGMWEGYNTENIGAPRWGLVLCLLLAWIMVWGCRKY